MRLLHSTISISSGTPERLSGLQIMLLILFFGLFLFSRNNCQEYLDRPFYCFRIRDTANWPLIDSGTICASMDDFMSCSVNKLADRGTSHRLEHILLGNESEDRSS
jgi:hypothetical protein